MENRKLGQITNRSTSQNSQVLTPEFNTYCSVFCNLLATQFTVNQINTIERLDEEDVATIAQIALFASPIILEIWTRGNQSGGVNEQQRRTG